MDRTDANLSGVAPEVTDNEDDLVGGSKLDFFPGGSISDKTEAVVAPAAPVVAALPAPAAPANDPAPPSLQHLARALAAAAGGGTAAASAAVRAPGLLAPAPAPAAVGASGSPPGAAVMKDCDSDLGNIDAGACRVCGPNDDDGLICDGYTLRLKRLSHYPIPNTQNPKS